MRTIKNNICIWIHIGSRPSQTSLFCILFVSTSSSIFLWRSPLIHVGSLLLFFPPKYSKFRSILTVILSISPFIPHTVRLCTYYIYIYICNTRKSTGSITSPSDKESDECMDSTGRVTVPTAESRYGWGIRGRKWERETVRERPYMWQSMTRCIL